MHKNTESMLLIKPQQAAQILAISQRTLWQLTKNGVIPCVHINHMVRYDQADIIAYIGSQKTITIDLIKSQNKAQCELKGA